MIRGYYFFANNKHFFIQTTQARKSKELTLRMIALIGAKQGFCPELISHCMGDKECQARIQKGMEPGTIEQKENSEGIYYTITTKTMISNYPEADYNKYVIVAC